MFFERIFPRFWRGFGSQNGSPNQFLECFLRYFFEGILESIFSRFLKNNLKFEPWFLCAQPVFCKDFQKINVFKNNPQKLDLGRIFEFPGIPKSILGATFSTKKAPTWALVKWARSSRSRFGRDLAPKLSPGRQFHWFGVVFGSDKAPKRTPKASPNSKQKNVKK